MNVDKRNLSTMITEKNGVEACFETNVSFPCGGKAKEVGHFLEVEIKDSEKLFFKQFLFQFLDRFLTCLNFALESRVGQQILPGGVGHADLRLVGQEQTLGVEATRLPTEELGN